MSRTTTILIGILVVQLAFLTITSSNRGHVTSKKPWLSVDTSEIDYVHIRNEDGDIVLKRIGGNWKITEPYNYRANQGYAQTMLEKLADLQRESFITSNRDKMADYELDDSTTVYVEVGKEGGEIDKFYCGKPNKNYTHTYMKPFDSDEVWLVAGTPRSSFTRKPKDWRDKKILDLDKTMIERIVITFDNEHVELVRDISSPISDTMLVQADTTWTVVPRRGKPFTPDDKPFNRVMNTASRMRATDFIAADSDSVPDFSRPELKVEIFLEGNQHEMVEYVQKPGTDNRWIVRKEGTDNTYFVVYKSSFNNLKKSADDFRPEPEDET